MLTAFFINADIKTLRHALPSDHSRMPDLASPPYVQCLSLLSRKDEILLQQHQSRLVDVDFNYADEITDILRAFQTFHSNQGGSMAYLAKLGQMQSELIGRCPRLCDNIGYASLLVASLARESHRITENATRYTLHQVEQCKGNIARAYQYFEMMSATLSTIIEKHVKHLSSDCATFLTVALTEIYQICLSTDRIVPTMIIHEHRKAHSPVANHHFPEAMAYHWRFTAYSKLIMSSQMQLRVMAATAMCNDLVQFWKRFNGPSDDAHAFLKYLADFLLRTGLVAYILGPTCHPEITMESSNIVGFLLVSETYTDAHTDSIWQTITSTQDPRVSEALIRMTCRISNLYPYDRLIYLCEKLNTVPVEAFSPIMRELCSTIVLYLKQKVDDRPALDISPYLLCLRLARQSSVFGVKSPVAYPDVLHFSTHNFTELLSCGPGPDGRRRIFLECKRDIGNKSRTSLGSLAVLSHMFSLRATVGREMQLLASEHDLATLIVDDMEAAIPAGRIAGFPAVLSGTQNAPRKDMILQILYSATSSITTDLGQRLWNLLVGTGAACREDRDAGWQIINYSFKQRPQLGTAFISTCFQEYLPTLPPECFCPGALEFVRAVILPLVNDANSILLDDQEGNGQDGVEQLWRMVLTAPPHTVEQQAIHTLVNDVYVESRSMVSFPPHRARKVHLAVANRCLRQLSTSATKLGSFNDGTTSGDDFEPMVIVASEQQVREQELLFIRSLAILRQLHQLLQSKTHFSVPDLSSLILDPPAGVEGDSAELKYQAFDWDTETDVLPLQIGRQNTMGSLLASLREASGFSNYRIYFNGRQFLPQETDVAKTLKDLDLQNGLVLVKREPDPPASPHPVRPGASPLENEILAHFQELWGYLSMEEKLAWDTYNFLITLPPDENILRAIRTVDIPYTELFPVRQPLKSLYALQALQKYLSSHREQKTGTHTTPEREPVRSEDGDVAEEYSAALSRGMSLIVAAMTDEDVLRQCPSQESMIELGSALVDCFVTMVRDPNLPVSAAKLLDGLLLDRLVAICLAPPPTSSSDTRTDHVRLCLQGIFESCSKSVDFWSAFRAYKPALKLVESSLLHDPRKAVRQVTASLISQKVTATDHQGVLEAGEFASFFWPLLFKLIEPAMDHAPGASELFDTCDSVFKQVLVSKPEALDPNSLFSFLSNRLLSYTTDEDVTRPDFVDDVARGLIQLMHSLVNSTDSPILAHRFPKAVFWKHLFPPFEEETSPSAELTAHMGMPKPILCTESRQKMIEIIFRLIDGSPERMHDLLEDLGVLVPYLADDGLSLGPTRLRPLLTLFPGEPYAYELSSQFERSKAVRAPCGYVGLRNLSNTCYLNSLFTQLFMNVPFRNFMLGARVEDANYAQSLLFHTQKLFAFMQDSIRRFVDPDDFVSTIKTYEDGQIDIHNQMDVDEFYNLLFDRWEFQLLPNARKEFRSFYGGQLVQQVRSKECEHISERLEPFSAIQCDIKGKSCLQESLQAYVDGEIMEGDNKYKCSTCDRHVDAVKRACLKDIPDNLIFHLKRFDFNLRTLQRSKINDHFAFPTQIDMRQYTIEHLSNPAKDIGEDVFELVGVLVHSGTAESGHYYSYVRQRPRSEDSEVWVEFNDDVVSSWDPTQLENACFGGLDYRPPFDGSVIYDKSYSAYMLFYQRASSLRTDQDLVRQTKLPIPARAPIPPEMSQHIRRENVSLLRRHCLYDPSQMDFVLDAIGRLDRYKVGKCSPRHRMEDTAIHMALGHLDQVASRTKDIPDFDRLIQEIRRLVQACEKCSRRVYQYFNEGHSSIRALIQRNPEQKVRFESSQLVIEAVRQIKVRLPHLYGQAIDLEDEGINRDLVLNGMMHIFHVFFNHFHISIRSWHEVFGFMVDYLKLGEDELATFLKYPFFKDLLMIITADQSLDLAPNFARMVGTISRRLPNRAPSYEKIIELLDMIMSVVFVERTGRNGIVAVDYPDNRFDNVHDIRGPFPLWRQEYRILVLTWRTEREATTPHDQACIFLEKLIANDQIRHATFSIIENYMRLGPRFEMRLLQTLKGCITGAVQVSPGGHINAPFIRVAARVFCHKATDITNIVEIVQHVNKQCQALENAEGTAFFEFYVYIFDLWPENAGETTEEALQRGLDGLCEWVPPLLGYFDSVLGHRVEDFLQDKLFTPVEDWEVMSDNLDAAKLEQDRFKNAQDVGTACLVYLRETYVTARANVPAHVVERFERVVKECSKYFDAEQEGADNVTTQFFRLYRCESITALFY